MIPRPRVMMPTWNLLIVNGSVSCVELRCAQVSRIDELVYGFALDRMYREAHKAKFTMFRRAK